MADNESSPVSSLHTYHCLCSTLILATPYTLDQLPTRSSSSPDQAIICPLSSEVIDQAEKPGDDRAGSTLHNVVRDRKPLIIRKEDGFEKRVILRCTRCNLVIGYRVEGDEDTNERIAYLLPGGLSSTEEMKTGQVPQQPGWGTQAT